MEEEYSTSAGAVLVQGVATYSKYQRIPEPTGDVLPKPGSGTP